MTPPETEPATNAYPPNHEMYVIHSIIIVFNEVSEHTDAFVLCWH